MILSKAQGSFDYKKNSISTLRLLAAIQVMWGHLIGHLDVSFFEIGRRIAIDEIISWLLSFFLGVPLFFFLSGYLLWISIDKYKNSKNYYFNRFLRIYPELWVGVAIEIICIIVFVSPINWRDLFLFTGTQATVLQFWTPDSLRSFGCGTPNGSLWTICVMIQFYIIVWPLKKLCRNKKISFWVLTEIFLILIGAATQYVEMFVPQIVYKLYCQTIVQYLWIFWLGMFIAEYKEIFIPVLMKYWYIPSIGAIVMKFSPFDIWSRAFPVFLSCFCLTAWLGLAYKFPKMKIKTDVSYALFIYHMIIVNVVIELGLSGSVGAIIGCIVSSFFFAYLSTVLIGRNIVKYRL